MLSQALDAIVKVGHLQPLRLDEQDLMPYRQEICMIFQDPYSSLNLRMPVLDIVSESLKINGLASSSELEDRVAALLSKVGLQAGIYAAFSSCL
jgi:peptide/nickel transport system ATP-binding protein